MKNKITTFIRTPRNGDIVKVYSGCKRHYFGTVEKVIVGKKESGGKIEKVVLNKIDTIPTVYEIDYYLDDDRIEN